MLRYAAPIAQKPCTKREKLPDQPGFPQSLLVTVAWRLAIRSIGPAPDRQGGGVDHYYASKNR